MRYRALLEATRDPDFRAAIGTKKEGEVPASWVLDASEFSEEQRRRFVIVDNAPDGMSGEWDWDMLANGWDEEILNDLGMELPDIENIDLDESQDSLEPPLKLSDRFGLPPFSVLNSREGWWQNRKRAWLALGIKSELGRGEQLIPNGGGMISKNRYSGGRACPGGSARPACNYSKKKARGDGRGRAI